MLHIQQQNQDLNAVVMMKPNEPAISINLIFFTYNTAPLNPVRRSRTSEYIPV
jgi:hypothetical protein